MKRFIKEYANYKIKKIENEPMMAARYTRDRIFKIKSYVEHYEKGRITVDETMELIARV